MKEFTKEKIESLSDIFCAWIGGIPEDDNDIKYFLSKHEDLAYLLNHRNIEHIVHFHAYFPQEVVKSIYTLLPNSVCLSNGKKYLIFEHIFEKLNLAESKISNSRTVNIDLSRACNIYIHKYAEKHRYMQKKYQDLCATRQKASELAAQREAYKRRRQNMSEEEKEVQRKKSREYARKWRAEHPENAEIAAKKQKERRQNRTELQILGDRITSRKANRKYRKNNKQQINLRRKEARLRMKEENPELLKELDKKINSSPKRAEICHTYYQKHKEEIKRKAKENPNTRVYKERYKIKKRWQEKTGSVVMNLLQAIALHKQSGR